MSLINKISNILKNDKNNVHIVYLNYFLNKLIRKTYKTKYFIIALLSLLLFSTVMAAYQHINLQTLAYVSTTAPSPSGSTKLLISSAISDRKIPILVLDLLIDRPNSKMELISIKKANGFVPDYRNSNAVDYLTVSVDSQIDIKVYNIPLPVDKLIDIENKSLQIPQKIDRFNQAVIIPDISGSNITISKQFDSTSSLISKIIFTIPTINNTITIQAQNPNLSVSQKSLTVKDSAVDPSAFTLETVFDGDPAQTDPTKTLDIVFIATNFSANQLNLFRTITDKDSDALIGMNITSGIDPFPQYKNIIKIRRLWPTVNISNYTQSDIENLLTQLGIPYDQVVLLETNNQENYSGGLGIGFIHLGIYFYPNDINNPIYDPLTFVHEMGHSFGGLTDEYYSTGEGDLWRYNLNCKEDPLIPWVGNITSGAYLGCNYVSTLWRPDDNSIMFNNSPWFNSPSKYILNETFSGYSNGINVTHESNFFNQTWDPRNMMPGQQRSSTIYNFSLLPFIYTINIIPTQPWISINTPLTGTINPNENFGILYTIDYSQLTIPNKYQTEIVINLDNQIKTKVLKIPINVYVGDSNYTPQLSMDYPMNGTTVETGSVNPISISQTINPSGWKWIEYLYKSPFQIISNGSFDFNFISTRTVAPYNASFTAAWPPEETALFRPGSYQLWVKGVPQLGKAVVTDPITISVKAKPGTDCGSGDFFSDYSCVNYNTSPMCFLGAQNCGNQYCCPLDAPVPTPKPGDINQNGVIDATDLIQIIKNWLGLDHCDSFMCDVNSDGKVNVFDASQVIINWGK